MRPHIFTLVLACSLAIGLEGVGFASSALDKSEAAIGKLTRNYRLLDQDNRFIAFHSFKGSPVLLNFIYTECPGPCLMITSSVQDIFEKMTKSIVDQVVFLTVSIDLKNDTPPKMKEYGQQFTDDFDRWTFAGVDHQTLEMMVADLGFRFEQTKYGFDHMNRMTLIGADMTILKHFYGTEFDPVEVEEALKATLDGKAINNMVSKVLSMALLYCSSYDPETNTYRIDYGLIASTLVQYVFMLLTLGYMFRKQIALYFKHFKRKGDRSVNI